MALLLKLSRETALIDVRTPSEYAQGHIPGATNIPLFTDDERAVVGTAYKKEGRERAVMIGLDYTGPKMSKMLAEGIRLAGTGKRIAIYCWRGGMRSASVAWLFSQGGLDTFILEGGYKAYRNYILNALTEKREIVVLGGLTGSGKTNILKELERMGEQVIDLEGIASHRGSAFGSLGMPSQPTSEHFANILYNHFAATNSSRRLFLEDESRNIGTVFMPDQVYDYIRMSRVVAVMTDIETRMPRLMEDYGRFDPQLLKESLQRISKRLGGEQAAEAISAVENGNVQKAIEIVLVYYDKAYRYGLSKRDPATVIKIETTSSDPAVNARLVLKALE